MKLRTEISIGKAPFQLHHNHEVVMFGSCFSENMSRKMNRAGWEISASYNGIVFHPEPIARWLKRCAQQEVMSFDEFIQTKESSFHWDMSGSHDENSANRAMATAFSSISRAEVAVITLGTSIGWRLKESGIVVANCHKQPQQWFEASLSTMDKLVEDISNIVGALRGIRPSIQVVFTVSPVRHLRQGMIENMRSKSRLIEAIYQVVDSGNAHYFPAYEIIMDDLRDYRFYADDMIHPNAIAIDYIFEKWCQWLMNEKTIDFAAQIASVSKIFDHKSDSEQHLNALSDAREKRAKLIHRAKLGH